MPSKLCPKGTHHVPHLTPTEGCPVSRHSVTSLARRPGVSRFPAPVLALYASAPWACLLSLTSQLSSHSAVFACVVLSAGDDLLQVDLWWTFSSLRSPGERGLLRLTRRTGFLSVTLHSEVLGPVDRTNMMTFFLVPSIRDNVDPVPAAWDRGRGLPSAPRVEPGPAWGSFLPLVGYSGPRSTTAFSGRPFLLLVCFRPSWRTVPWDAVPPRWIP